MLIRPATPADTAAIDALLDAAFGPGRHARTASRLRAGAVPLDGPSLVARADDGALLGSIQLWPIALVPHDIPTASAPPSHSWEGSGVGGGVATLSLHPDVASPPRSLPPPDPLPPAGGGAVPLTLLGPVAVAPNARSIGLGRRLIAASLAVADAAGRDSILLIGDLSYYGRFGFAADATAGWTLPGPVERERLLLRQRLPRPLPVAGYVVAADSVTARSGAMVAVDA